MFYRSKTLSLVLREYRMCIFLRRDLTFLLSREKEGALFFDRIFLLNGSLKIEACEFVSLASRPQC